MKHFIDGNQLVVVKDNFVNLHESPATFLALDDPRTISILKFGSFGFLPVWDYAKLLDGLTQQESRIAEVLPLCEWKLYDSR